MTYFVLVLWIVGMGSTFQIIEFKTETACLAAKDKLTYGHPINAECVEIK